jgi:hypothetical protein
MLARGNSLLRATPADFECSPNHCVNPALFWMTCQRSEREQLDSGQRAWRVDALTCVSKTNALGVFVLTRRELSPENDAAPFPRREP